MFIGPNYTEAIGNELHLCILVTSDAGSGSRQQNLGTGFRPRLFNCSLYGLNLAQQFIRLSGPIPNN